MMQRFALIFIFFIALRSSAGENLVVWDFATRSGDKNKITQSLTYEFEESLSQRCSYNVLERRNLDRLQMVIENEKALHDIGQITAGGATELRRLGADLVVFGEIFDDIDSGEVVVTISVQDSQGKKVRIKSTSLRRGLVLDAASRRGSMTTLAASLCTDVETTAQTHELQSKRMLLRAAANSCIPSCSADFATLPIRRFDIPTTDGSRITEYVVTLDREWPVPQYVHIKVVTETSSSRR